MYLVYVSYLSRVEVCYRIQCIQFLMFVGE